MRSVFRAWVVLGSMCLSAGVALAADAESARPRMAMGLIVKLKDSTAQAPSVVRLQAASLPTESAARVRTRLAAATQRQRVGYLVQKPTAFAANVIHDGHPVSLDEAEARASKLRADPDVEWVVVNEMLRPASTVTGQTVVANDPSYADQTWLQTRAAGRRGVADIPSAWQQLAGRTLTPVVVAVLDSGILAAPDLAGRVLPGYDFVSELEYARDGNGLDNDPSDPGDWLTTQEKDANPLIYENPCTAHNSNWHGLTVSYMLAAVTGNSVNGAGILAPLPGQVLLPVRVAGICGASVSDIVEGMLWAAGLNYNGSPALNPNPARVINLSFGGDGSCTDSSTAAWYYRQTIATLANKGVLVVASAGNGYDDDHTNGDDDNIGLAEPTRPANCSGVLAVTGLNQRGYKATYANLISSAHTGVAVASGDAFNSVLTDDGIESLVNRGTTGPTTPGLEAGYEMRALVGTSYAAPTAAGVAALMLAVAPGLSVSELLNALTTEVEPFLGGFGLPDCAAGSSSTRGSCQCTTQTCGSGMLDADRAVAWAVARAGTTPYPGSSSSTSYFTPDRLQPVAQASGGKSGGGAIDGWALLALAGAVLGLALIRFRADKR